MDIINKNVVIFIVCHSVQRRNFKVNEVLKKLKLTTQNPVLILNAPEEYNDVIKDIESEVHTEINGKYKFIQLFVKSLEELNENVSGAIEALDGDGYLWVCYPKGTSKKYKKLNINRDNLFEAVQAYNYYGVTLVSLDSDWSAFRIRHADYINSKNLREK
jgi:hypothetical protein